MEIVIYFAQQRQTFNELSNRGVCSIDIDIQYMYNTHSSNSIVRITKFLFFRPIEGRGSTWICKHWYSNWLNFTQSCDSFCFSILLFIRKLDNNWNVCSSFNAIDDNSTEWRCIESDIIYECVRLFTIWERERRIELFFRIGIYWNWSWSTIYIIHLYECGL